MRRLAELEQRVAELERGQAARVREPGPGDEDDDEARFWALHGLQRRLPEGAGAVLFTGVVPMPTGGQYIWQQGADTAALLDEDWSALSQQLNALGHPVRLLLLRRVLSGARTAAELQELEGLGTSGQLYHHLRPLVAAGWLRATARGQYEVPGSRVVPLLVVLSAMER
ncbi:MAG: helix-turn-helix domain-containing protein [Streptosporangiales bacterium]|nr:helix-turn-helix domain-containing protein [Streptosporangiales bacterium]